MIDQSEAHNAPQPHSVLLAQVRPANPWFDGSNNLDWLPHDLDFDAILNQVHNQGYSAPESLGEAIRSQIVQAQQEGVQLKVVYIPTDYHSRTLLRDIADRVQHFEHGTVMVFSPVTVAASSDVYPRVAIERSEDHLPVYRPESTVITFAEHLQAPVANYTEIVSVVSLLTLAVFVGALVTRKKKTLLRLFRRG